MRPRVTAGALAIALGGALIVVGAAARRANAQVLDRVVASVDGQPITAYDVKAFSAATGAPMPPPGDPGAARATQEVIQGLIAQKLLEAESRKFANKITSEQVTNYIATIEAQNHMTDKQFRARLQQSGVSYDDFRRHTRLELEKMAMLQQELRQKIVVSDKQVADYYRSHPEDFTVKSERFRLRQILIATPPGATPQQIAAARARAEQLRERVLKGESFEDLASKYSDDDSKNKGGELGWYAPDEIMPQIYAAVKELRSGQISPPVQSQYGWHLLKVQAHIQPGMKPLDKVSSEIRAKLQTEETKQHFASWVKNDLMKRHEVETFH